MDVSLYARGRGEACQIDEARRELTNEGDRMGFGQEYGALLEAIANEADAIAMRYFRADAMRVERKGDGTAVTQADRAVEEMSRAKVTASGLALDVFGEEMGDGRGKAASSAGRARLIIDPI